MSHYNKSRKERIYKYVKPQKEENYIKGLFGFFLGAFLTVMWNPFTVLIGIPTICLSLMYIMVCNTKWFQSIKKERIEKKNNKKAHSFYFEKDKIKNSEKERNLLKVRVQKKQNLEKIAKNFKREFNHYVSYQSDSSYFKKEQTKKQNEFNEHSEELLNK